MKEENILEELPPVNVSKPSFEIRIISLIEANYLEELPPVNLSIPSFEIRTIS